jgi:acyl-CoA dehydrogenase
MSEERALIAETCDRLFAEHLDDAVFRAAEAGEFPVALWAAIAEAGLDRVLVPEDLGGIGLGWEDAFVVLRAAGVHAAPVPLAEAVAAGWLLARFGGEIPDGILTLADDRARVPWGRAADHAVCPAKDGVVCVPLSGVTAEDRNVGRDPRDALPVAGEGEGDARDLDHPLRLAGALARACQMAGAVSAVLDLCVEYANDRVQFGRPIGRFQAIQQQLAVLAGDSAAAEAAARAACAVMDSGNRDPFPAVAAAKIRAGEAAGKAAATGHQVLGAIGFTEEHRLHYLTRRLWSWRAEFGTDAAWADALGRHVVGRGAGRLWPDLTG